MSQNDQFSDQDPGHVPPGEPFEDHSGALEAAAELPDPSGPPTPVTETQPGCSMATTLIGLLAAGGVGVLLLPVLTGGRTAGATRSAQLQWHQREVEIQKVVSQEQARRQAIAEDARVDEDATEQ